MGMYTQNPQMAPVRRRAVQLVRTGWSARAVGRHLGYHHTAILKWVRRAPADGRIPIPARSCRPHRHPRQLPPETVWAIVAERERSGSCAELIHQRLLRAGYALSLSSVKRTLSRKGYGRRSPWKRRHAPVPRPRAEKPGDLVEIDTIHVGPTPVREVYVYTLLDVASRWAHAAAVPAINARRSLRFVREAQDLARFRFAMLQSDHGSEFSGHFSERAGTSHRHSRVRTPNDNGHLERFNRTIQDECLRRELPTLAAYRKVLPEYLRYYNQERMHMGIEFMTPMEKMSQLVPSY